MHRVCIVHLKDKALIDAIFNQETVYRTTDKTCFLVWIRGSLKIKKKTDSVLLLRVELLFFKILWQMATHADLTCLGTLR